MSDDISVSDGGFIAVSSDDLRDAARRVLVASDDATTAKNKLTAASDELDCLTIGIAAATSAAAFASVTSVVVWLMERLAHSLLAAADVYEVAELMITVHMNGTDTAAIDARIAELTHERPWVHQSATELTEAWRFTVTGESGRGPAGLALAVGSLAPVRQLKREGIDVTIASRERMTTTDVSSIAPDSVEDLARAIPSGDAQVRIEKYEMPDGTNRFVVSASGTKTWLDSNTEPSDMESNIELFDGRDAASAEALRLAMEDAGVQPDDWVLVNGHSQAAMVANRIAPESPYGVDMLVTWGSPINAAVPEDIVSVDIQHSDDPITWLGGAQYPLGTGAPGSLDVTREVGSEADGLFGAHHMTQYVKTAALMDGSQDPRMDALTEPLSELSGADRVTVTEYVLRTDESQAYMVAPSIVGEGVNPLRDAIDDRLTPPAGTQDLSPRERGAITFFPDLHDPSATAPTPLAEMGGESARSRITDHIEREKNRAAPWMR